MRNNIFSGYLEDVKNSGDPFVKVMVPKLQSKIKLLASNGNFDLNVRSERILKREAKILTRSLNKAGLIVPYVKK